MSDLEYNLLNNSVDVQNIFSYIKKNRTSCKQLEQSSELYKTYRMNYDSYGYCILAELEFLYNNTKELQEKLKSFENTKLTLIEKSCKK